MSTSLVERSNADSTTTTASQPTVITTTTAASNREDHHKNYTSSTKNSNSDIGDWYWLVDDKDNLIRICKSISFSDDSGKTDGEGNSKDGKLATKPRSIFDFLEGDDIKSIYKNIHSLIRSGKEKRVAFVWRCDTPTLCNHMYMVITLFPQNKNYLLYHSLVLRSYPHSVPFLANLGGEARRPALSVCSFCFRVQPPGTPDTASVNEYYYQGGTNNVNVSRYVCEGCRFCFNDFLHPRGINETLGLPSPLTSDFMKNSGEALKLANEVAVNLPELKVPLITPIPGNIKEIQETPVPVSVPDPSTTTISSTTISAVSTTTPTESTQPPLRPENLKRNFSGISEGENDSKRPAKEPVLATSSEFSGLNILFVDDSRLNQCILGRMMKRAGMQISVASSGADAVILVRSKMENGLPFDIILMDCVMPGELDGFAATSKIREFSQVPIIAATGLPKETWETSYKPSGMNDYLPKPFNIKDVLSLLTKWAPRPPQ